MGIGGDLSCCSVIYLVIGWSWSLFLQHQSPTDGGKSASLHGTDGLFECMLPFDKSDMPWASRDGLTGRGKGAGALRVTIGGFNITVGLGGLGSSLYACTCCKTHS